jgi:hypothetical protein
MGKGFARMNLYDFVPTLRQRQAWMGLLTLLLVFLMGDRWLGILLDQAMLNTQFRYSMLYGGHAQADVLVLGNSRAVNSFYAPELGKRLRCRCVNLAYNGMSPDVALALFQDFLERHRAPRLLILEGTCVDNSSMCVVNLKPYWRHSSRLTAIARRVAPKSVVASKLSRLFDYNCELFFRALSYRRGNDQSWINRYTIDKDLVRLTQQMAPLELPGISAEEVRSLRAIFDLAVQHGTELRVVIAPYLPAYRMKLTNFEPWKAELQAALPNAEIIDLSLRLTDTACFADRLHTNLRGSNAILDELERHNLFAALH